MFIVFSFGHVLSLFESLVIAGIQIGRIRYLGIFFIFLFFLGISGVFRTKKLTNQFTNGLLVFSLFLTIIPTWKIIEYQIKQQSLQITKTTGKQNHISPSPTWEDKSNVRPDIYYIIFDAYTRSDVLNQVYGFDNSPFIDNLRNLGFFVADCSESNYLHTLYSLPSSLNMNYLNDLDTRLQPPNYDYFLLRDLIEHSIVRKTLQQLGYKFVAFENGYVNTQIKDADIYIKNSKINFSYLLNSYINPFEEMFLKTTAAVAFYRIDFGSISNWLIMNRFPYFEHANIFNSQIQNLSEISRTNGPKFVFVHFNTPHRPFIFDEDGEILTDPNYYSDNGKSISKKYERDGYIKQIINLNNKFLPTLKYIFEYSESDPVIIIQADHGHDTQNRSKIFTAIYFPDQNYDSLYPSISPVNIFRLVFNKYFDTSYSTLPDKVMEVYPEQDFSYFPVDDTLNCGQR